VTEGGYQKIIANWIYMEKALRLGGASEEDGEEE
jgi:hypothetical protein